MSATTTGQQVLNATLAIMDELGSTEYNARSVYFINILCDKLYPYSDNYKVPVAGTRPVVTHIAALTDTLGIDDVLAQSVLPYGLAAQLMLSDDPAQAGNFESVFQERIAETAGRTSSDWEQITDVYGFSTGSTITNSW